MCISAMESIRRRNRIIMNMAGSGTERLVQHIRICLAVLNCVIYADWIWVIREFYTDTRFVTVAAVTTMRAGAMEREAMLLI